MKTYDFDETGFMTGVAATLKVVTSSDTVGRAVTVQPSNREWVTVIEAINAAGWAIPPFIILAGWGAQLGGRTRYAYKCLHMRDDGARREQVAISF